MDFKRIDEDIKRYKESKPFSQNTLNSIREDLILRWTCESNALEGNTFTLSETKVFLENGITIGGKTYLEHSEILNHKKAILFMEKELSEKKEISEGQIKQIQEIIMFGIEEKMPGQYRNDSIVVTGSDYSFPTSEEVPVKMGKLIDWYNNFSGHPVEKAALLHEKFVTIHPFFDGNGRTARILLNMELMKNGYPPIIIEKKEKKIYNSSLKKAQTRGNNKDFLEFIKTKVEDRIEKLLDLMEREQYTKTAKYEITDEINEELKRAVWMKKNGNYEEANNIYKELIEKNGPYGLLYIEQAKNYACMGKYENAIKLFELANESCKNELGKEDPNCMYHISRIKERENDTDFIGYMKQLSGNKDFKLKDNFYEKYQSNKNPLIDKIKKQNNNENER